MVGKRKTISSTRVNKRKGKTKNIQLELETDPERVMTQSWSTNDGGGSSKPMMSYLTVLQLSDELTEDKKEEKEIEKQMTSTATPEQIFGTECVQFKEKKPPVMCRNKDCRSQEVQRMFLFLRGQDEPPILFCKCKKCPMTWRM